MGIPAYAGSSRWVHPPSGKRRNGISSAVCPICPPRASWCYSTAAGTTGPVSSGILHESEYMEFLHSCPEFERMLVRAGIVLIKYWFSLSDEEQERRFQARMKDPTKRWNLSAMDVQSRSR